MDYYYLWKDSTLNNEKTDSVRVSPLEQHLVRLPPPAPSPLRRVHACDHLNTTAVPSSTFSVTIVTVYSLTRRVDDKRKVDSVSGRRSMSSCAFFGLDPILRHHIFAHFGLHPFDVIVHISRQINLHFLLIFGVSLYSESDE